MKIGELEDLLGITRANIRYYEKEGLLSVERKENKYRDYTDIDISQLKRIIVLRKIGVSIEDMRAYLKKEKTLNDILDASINDLEASVKSVKGSLSIAKRLSSEKEDFDEDLYFDLITDEEQKGLGFISICKDISTKSRNTFDDTLKYLFGEDYKQLCKRKGVKSAFITLLVYLFIYLLCQNGMLGTTLEDMLILPLRFIFFTTVIGFPILFFRRSYSKLANTYFKIMVGIEILMTVYCLYIIVGALIKAFIR